MARPPKLQVLSHLSALDALIRSRERREELLAVPLGHQAGIGQHEHTGIGRRPDQTAGSLLDLQHRLGQRVAGPCPILAHAALT